MEIISFTINLEHAGDIIDKNLCEVATKKIRRKLQFSPEGATELADFHKRVRRRKRSNYPGRAKIDNLVTVGLLLRSDGKWAFLGARGPFPYASRTVVLSSVK
jgi:hypothetical protein